MSYDDCPGCGREDLGWNMSDVRQTLHISDCRCVPSCVCSAEEKLDFGDADFDDCICEENGCDCGQITIKVKVRRVFDRECEVCMGADYRCVYDVLLDGKTVKTCSDESEADSFVAKVFPTAKHPDPDWAWISERPLRIAEGWGC
jgi:hypothetical protein